jgi:hypothetical protein
MKGRLWLEKRDLKWEQLVKWNAAREKLLDGFGYVLEIYNVAEHHCPLVEEAQWFVGVFCRVYSPDPWPLRTTLRWASETDLKAKTYLAIIEKDYGALKECADQGHPMAQYRYAMKYPEGSRDEQISLFTSAAGAGYSEAFYGVSRICRNLGRYDESSRYLTKAIQLGSLNAIIEYGRYRVSDRCARIYWRGQEWLNKLTSTSVPFITDLVNWYRDSINAQEGFIYGHIISLVDPQTIQHLKENKEIARVLPAILEAQTVYQTMINNAKAAIRWWSLVGLRNGVVKDIRLLIAKMVWASRDQPQWYPKWQSPIFE